MLRCARSMTAFSSPGLPHLRVVCHTQDVGILCLGSVRAPTTAASCRGHHPRHHCGMWRPSGQRWGQLRSLAWRRGHACYGRHAGRLCLVRGAAKKHLDVPGMAQPAGMLRATYGRPVWLACGGRQARGRSPDGLVITLALISSRSKRERPKYGPAARASGSSESRQLLVTCVPDACGVARTNRVGCACRMRPLRAVVIRGLHNHPIHRYSSVSH